MTDALDHYTRQIRGAVQATRGRVIWRNGRLYVITPVRRVHRQITVFAAPDAPTSVSTGRQSQDWTAAGVTWRKGPCGCGFPGALKVSSQVLVKEADAAIADGTTTLRGVTEAADA